MVAGIEIEMETAASARGEGVGPGPALLLASLRQDVLKAPDRLSGDRPFLDAVSQVVQLRDLVASSSALSAQPVLPEPQPQRTFESEHYEPFGGSVVLPQT
mmetsp:Transcript_50161/g.166102  ORF Transcript_50161/g.166102 Transcript_50161/m.166102 type:complete len:101 (+) Transcript_50161:900-1202(+)